MSTQSMQIMQKPSKQVAGLSNFKQNSALKIKKRESEAGPNLEQRLTNKVPKLTSKLSF